MPELLTIGYVTTNFVANLDLLYLANNKKKEITILAKDISHLVTCHRKVAQTKISTGTHVRVLVCAPVHVGPHMWCHDNNLTFICWAY